MLIQGFSLGQVLHPHHRQLQIYTTRRERFIEGREETPGKQRWHWVKLLFKLQHHPLWNMEGPAANIDAVLLQWKMFPIKFQHWTHPHLWNSQISHSSKTKFCVCFCEYSSYQMDIRHIYTLNTLSQVEVLCCYGF